MEEWIKKVKKECEETDHPECHTARYAPDDVLDIITALDRAEKEIERLNKQNDEHLENATALVMLQKKQLAELNPLRMLLMYAEKIDYDYILEAITFYINERNEGDENDKEQIRELQQAIAQVDKGEK